MFANVQLTPTSGDRVGVGGTLAETTTVWSRVTVCPFPDASRRYAYVPAWLRQSGNAPLKDAPSMMREPSRRMLTWLAPPLTA
ncbi:MAG: hypothetical protein IPM76_09595 [Chloroflexi bacterium]|nr:hypothetical protein [Chloroflexota bacterium]